MPDFPYVWHWRAHPDELWMTQLDRKGQRCRVLARGTMNSALIEFEDGFRSVVSRNGLRKAVYGELAQVLAELELRSHVSAVNLEPSTKDVGEGDDVGGHRPPGGVDRREDNYRPPSGDETDNERVLRSAAHFRQQLARGRDPERILAEAKESLAAWLRMPAPNNEPDYGSPQWKRWVAESPLTAKEIADKYGVKKRYINRVRADYREKAAAA